MACRPTTTGAGTGIRRVEVSSWSIIERCGSTETWLRFAGVAACAWLLACGDDTGDAGGSSAGGNGAGASGEGGAGPAGGSGGEGAGIVGADPGAPVIFYTDLATAPALAYVTLWGNGFGDAQGTATVSLGGAPLEVVSWSMRRIEVKLPGDAEAGDLVVSRDADSPPVALGVHTGTLYFVSPSGDDAAAGDEGAPFRTLTRGRDALAAGDVLYVREGSYTGEDQFSAVLSLYDVPPGAADAPVAIVGYPGETATIGDGTLLRGLSLYTLELGAAQEWQSYDVDIVEREVPNAPITGVTENVGFYRRTGDSIEVRIYTEFSAAPAGGNYLAWTLPDGLSIDSAKLPGGSIGFGFRDALGVAELDGVAGVVGPAPGSLVDAIAAGDAVGPANGAVPLGAGSTINLSFTVPVVP